jgi:DNA transposition AAA+ family ATPase
MAVSVTQAEAVMHNAPLPAAEILVQGDRYMAAAGMGIQEMAHAIGYSPITLQKFFTGRYREIAGTDIYIRDALQHFMEAHPLGAADDVPAKLIRSWDTRLILERIEQAQMNAQIIVVEGPPGTSKTSVAAWFAAERNRVQKRDAFFVRATEGITGVDLLRRIGEALEVPTRRLRYRILRSSVRALRERRPCVLLVDEAQRLTEHTTEPFETLRDVIDLAHCGCVLLGHYNFIGSLSNGLGRQVEQWLSRIDVREHLRGLQANELPEIARDYFGEDLDPRTLALIEDKSQAPDRNWAFRARISGQKFGRRYLNFRRVRKIFEGVEKLHKLPGNEKASLPGLIRAAADQMMEAM